ncbi:hypothetical protein IAI10_20040 [Clostridium sp. 19966]|uniref:hypothetical protein n=1 Tax=Clostridium sp. 19966 TaxID=2768166 RepID=UPI0028DE262D|nr:hypothetical protein [Clostridium sp. 19966]MDT8718947.1 hypothetical protein [Clostridium sp. 19966]
MFFYDENKKTVAGISLVAYDEDYNSSLPKNVSIVSEEDIETNFGPGKLITLKTAKSIVNGNPNEQLEFHALIPMKGSNIAQDFWAKGSNKDALLSMISIEN